MNKYELLKKHYESCYEAHGDSSLGMDWPNEQDLSKRFEVLTKRMQLDESHSLLDLGCGIGLLINYLQNENKIQGIHYEGIDISEKMIQGARKNFPDFNFKVQDILQEPLQENRYDYILMNGVFTEKREMTYEEMFAFFKSMIRNVFKAARKGIAFNVMSSHVDWEREDLFHLKTDDLLNFLTKECTRNVIIDMDYGLYEYTVSIRK